MDDNEVTAQLTLRSLFNPLKIVPRPLVVIVIVVVVHAGAEKFKSLLRIYTSLPFLGSSN